MKITSVIVCLFFISGCGSSAKVASPIITNDKGRESLVLPKTAPGKWAITVKDYLGIEKYLDCVDPNQLMAETLNQSSCQVTDMRQSDGTYTYIAKCNQLEGINGKTGTITFSISGADSSFSLVSQVKSDEADFRTEVQAKRIGDCSPLRGPVNSCVQTTGLNCSDGLGSVYIPYFHGKFEPACIQHDYCYRHGWETYRFTKGDCDNRFRAQMMKRCSGIVYGMGWSCRNAASLYYNAVKEFAGSSYQEDGKSTCCTFAEEAEPCQQCQEGGAFCPVPAPPPPPPPPPPYGRCCETDYETGKCLLYVKPPQQCP